MKKLILLSTVVLALGLTVTLDSCKKDNPVSCTEKALEVVSTGQAYGSDPSSANCIDYKNAINDYMDCDIVTQEMKDNYLAILATLDC